MDSETQLGGAACRLAGVLDTDDRPSLARPGVLERAGLVLPAFVAGIAALIGSRPLDDNSFLTHLATGRLILEHGFPHHDPYTFTASGEPWVVQSWFASLLYGLADRAGDLDGVRILTAVLAGAVGLVAWRLTAAAAAPVARLLAWAPLAAVGTGYWVERPLVFGLLMLGLTLLAAEEGMDRRWLLLVGWIWVNSHGSWPLGLVALGAIAVGQRLDKTPVAATLNAGRWLLGGIALGAVNPYGPRLLAFPLELLSRQESLRTIVEWQAPRFVDTDERAFLLLLILAVVALCRAPRWRTAVPLVLFAAAALVGARNIPIAALVLLPGLAGGLQGIGSAAADVRRSVLRRAVPVVVAVGVVVAFSGIDQPAADLGRYPVATTTWMEAHGLDPRTTRVIAPELVGNYWELRYGEDANVFVDDRMEVLPPAVVQDHLTLVRGRPGWAEVLDHYDAGAVLWPAAAPLAQLLALDPEWVEAHVDGGYVLFTRG